MYCYKSISFSVFNRPWSVLQKFSTHFSTLLDLESATEFLLELRRRETSCSFCIFSPIPRIIQLELAMSVDINSRVFSCYFRNRINSCQRDCGACEASAARPRDYLVACCYCSFNLHRPTEESLLSMTLRMVYYFCAVN